MPHTSGEMASLKGPVIGIDLGTWKCCVGVVRKGKVEIIKNERGSKTTPSYVAFTETERLVGEDAEDQVALNPTNTVFGVKRIIGRRFDDPHAKTHLGNFPFTTKQICGSGRTEIRVHYRRESKWLPPEHLTAMLLRKMKLTAEAYLGCPVQEAVVSVPVCFNSGQRQATLDAAEIAGLKVLQLLHEPTAVALAYKDQAGRGALNQTVMVVDAGGGTLQAAVASIKDGLVDVKAVSGNAQFGGCDLDQFLVDECSKRMQFTQKIDISKNKKAQERLRVACHKAKCDLTLHPQTTIQVDSLVKDTDFETTIHREEFNKLFREQSAKLIPEVVKDALKGAHLNVDQIDKVLVVGGSSQIPEIITQLKGLFLGKKLNACVNIDEAVAHGAALQAALLAGDHTVADTSISDVTPRDFYIEHASNRTERGIVFGKNCTIPLEKIWKVSRGVRGKQTLNLLEEDFGLKPIKSYELQFGYSINIFRKEKVLIKIDRNGLISELPAPIQEFGSVSVLKSYNGNFDIEPHIRVEESFQSDEENEAMRLQASMKLESTCIEIKSAVKGFQNENGEQKFMKTYAKKCSGLITSCNECIDWLDNNPNVSMRKCNSKTAELEERFENLSVAFNSVIRIKSEENETTQNNRKPARQSEDRTPKKNVSKSMLLSVPDIRRSRLPKVSDAPAMDGGGIDSRLPQASDASAMHGGGIDSPFPQGSDTSAMHSGGIHVAIVKNAVTNNPPETKKAQFNLRNQQIDAQNERSASTSISSTRDQVQLVGVTDRDEYPRFSGPKLPSLDDSNSLTSAKTLPSERRNGSVTSPSTTASKSATSPSTTASDSVTSPSTTSNGSVTSPSTTASFSVTSPSTTASDSVTSPSITSNGSVTSPSTTASKSATSPSTTASDSVTSPSTTSNGSVTSPSTTASFSVTSPSTTASDSVTSPSITSNGSVTSPSTKASKSATSPSTTSNGSVTSPSTTASKSATSPSTTASDSVTSPSTTSNGSVTSPSTTASFSVTSPSTTASDPVTSPCTTSNGSVTSPSTTSNRSVTSLSTTASDSVTSPSTTTNGSVTSPSTTASDSVTSPSTTASGSVTSPTTTASDSVTSPSTTSNSSVTSLSTTASDSVTSPSTTTNGSVTSPSTTASDSVTSPSTTASDSVTSPSTTASDFVTSSSTTSNGSVTSPSTTASDSVTTPSTTSNGSVTSPSTTASDPVTSPSTTSNGCVTSPCTTASDSVTSPSTTSNGSVTSSSTTASDSVTSPSTTASGSVTSPSTTASDSVTSPCTTVSGSVTSPSTTASGSVTSSSTTSNSSVTSPSIAASGSVTSPSTTSNGSVTSPSTTARDSVTSPSTTSNGSFTSHSITASDSVTSPSTTSNGSVTSPSATASDSVTGPSTTTNGSVTSPSTTASGSLTSPSTAPSDSLTSRSTTASSSVPSLRTTDCKQGSNNSKSQIRISPSLTLHSKIHNVSKTETVICVGVQENTNASDLTCVKSQPEICKTRSWEIQAEYTISPGTNKVFGGEVDSCKQIVKKQCHWNPNSEFDLNSSMDRDGDNSCINRKDVCDRRNLAVKNGAKQSDEGSSVSGGNWEVNPIDGRQDEVRSVSSERMRRLKGEERQGKTSAGHETTCEAKGGGYEPVRKHPRDARPVTAINKRPCFLFAEIQQEETSKQLNDSIEAQKITQPRQISQRKSGVIHTGLTKSTPENEAAITVDKQATSQLKSRYAINDFSTSKPATASPQPLSTPQQHNSRPEKQPNQDHYQQQLSRPHGTSQQNTSSANQHKSPAIGIDLGTWKCCVGLVREGKVEIIENEHGSKTTPSYVAFTETERLVGEDAKDQVAHNPTNTVFGVKRIIGRKFNNQSLQKDMKFWPFTVTPDQHDRPRIQLKYREQKKILSPELVSAMMLEKMKRIAETHLGCEVKDAVISVPAYFNNVQRQATKDAGAIAGLNVLGLINEPTAAALAYRDNKARVEPHNVLIFDLGGGTFDVAVIRVDESGVKVKGVCGDAEFGGNEMDVLLMKHFDDEFFEKHGKHVLQDKKSQERLRTASEKAKKTLTLLPKTNFQVDSLIGDIDFSASIKRHDFEQLYYTDAKKRIVNVLTNVLKEAIIPPFEIDEVVLVGGTSRIPKIQSILKEFFGGKALNKTVNPDEAVAHGAALHAALHSEVEEVHVAKLVQGLANCHLVEQTAANSFSTKQSSENVNWITLNECLTKPEVTQLAADVCQFAQDDQELKEGVAAMSDLEAFCFQTNALVTSNRLRQKLGQDELRGIADRCEEMICWLDDNDSATKTEYQFKKRELCCRILSVMEKGDVKMEDFCVTEPEWFREIMKSQSLKPANYEHRKSSHHLVQLTALANHELKPLQQPAKQTPTSNKQVHSDPLQQPAQQQPTPDYQILSDSYDPCHAPPHQVKPVSARGAPSQAHESELVETTLQSDATSHQVKPVSARGALSQAHESEPEETTLQSDATSHQVKPVSARGAPSQAHESEPEEITLQSDATSHQVKPVSARGAPSQAHESEPEETTLQSDATSHQVEHVSARGAPSQAQASEPEETLLRSDEDSKHKIEDDSADYRAEETEGVRQSLLQNCLGYAVVLPQPYENVLKSPSFKNVSFTNGNPQTRPKALDSNVFTSQSNLINSVDSFSPNAKGAGNSLGCLSTDSPIISSIITNQSLSLSIVPPTAFSTDRVGSEFISMSSSDSGISSPRLPDFSARTDFLESMKISLNAASKSSAASHSDPQSKSLESRPSKPVMESIGGVDSTRELLMARLRPARPDPYSINNDVEIIPINDKTIESNAPKINQQQQPLGADDSRIGAGETEVDNQQQQSLDADDSRAGAWEAEVDNQQQQPLDADDGRVEASEAEVDNQQQQPLDADDSRVEASEAEVDNQQQQPLDADDSRVEASEAEVDNQQQQPLDADDSRVGASEAEVDDQQQPPWGADDSRVGASEAEVDEAFDALVEGYGLEQGALGCVRRPSSGSSSVVNSGLRIESIATANSIDQYAKNSANDPITRAQKSFPPQFGAAVSKPDSQELFNSPITQQNGGKHNDTREDQLRDKDTPASSSTTRISIPHVFTNSPASSSITRNSVPQVFTNSSSSSLTTRNSVPHVSRNSKQATTTFHNKCKISSHIPMLIPTDYGNGLQQQARPEHHHRPPPLSSGTSQPPTHPSSALELPINSPVQPYTDIGDLERDRRRSGYAAGREDEHPPPGIVHEMIQFFSNPLK